MVLERMLTVRLALRSLSAVFLTGGAVSVICVIIAWLVLGSSIGLFSTFLVTFVMTPFMIELVRYEEARDGRLIDRSRVGLFTRYRQILRVYVAFFAGVIVAQSTLYVVLPDQFTQLLFQDQISEITAIRGRLMLAGPFVRIITNNLGVLAFSFAFSFLFGAGAVFILTWNASVLATAIGMAAKSVGGLHGLPLAVLIYLPHGSLEILAYFIAGIAGGLISAGLTRRRARWFRYTLRDSAMLMCVSVLLLIAAAAIESFALIF